MKICKKPIDLNALPNFCIKSALTLDLNELTSPVGKFAKLIP